MAVNLELLQIKLDAILDKDIDAIFDAQVFLPFIGTSYTKLQLQNWLQVRIDLLEDAKTRSDSQILALINAEYDTLDEEHQLIADRIIARLPSISSLRPTTAAGYEKLARITLWIWVTSP